MQTLKTKFGFKYSKQKPKLLLKPVLPHQAHPEKNPMRVEETF